MTMKFSRNTILFVFMIGTFAIGMTEYAVTGLLTQFAADLDVPVSTTGLLLSVYAISVAVCGPLLRILTVKFSPKPLLIALISIFIISNIIAATAPTFEVLLLSRLFSAIMHAPFFGLCMSMAVEISQPHKRTSSIAAVQGGLTIAIMLGVPFGSYIGGVLDWRLVFWFIAAMGVINLIGLMIVTPNIKQNETPKLKNEMAVLKNKNVWMLIAVIVFGFSGVFTAYTFTEPMLRDIAGFDVTSITIALFLFGLGAVIGNFVSGSIQPEVLTERLIVAMTILGTVLIAITFLFMNPILTYVACFLFGAGTFGTTPILNAKIILAATEAPALSGTIAASVFNLANSIGATLGSLLLTNQFSYREITFVAGGMIFFGVVLMFVTHKIEDKSLFRVSEEAYE
ncbi:MFS transporter [Oceanobacillus oncorhynchi subsp. incaldanensis]|uniref:Inner membrane transport protein YdhP n=1 Tax=Oceanobacillus oncorhynchi TaxID=545501 RepID=A0A0A1MHQ0_9BACI|nr:MFS transporter [Oceanobacillus oncorhynchi]GIO19291.1 MFS transporter [Oceanobacillus oncorhynchi subsp. incaldanensis]CEI82613.1 Inner membrane transport protein YdhP [Oceanobacillus oncorhynchi]